MRYYLKNDKDEKIVEFTMDMYPEGYIIKDAEIINDNLLPSFFNGKDFINEKIDDYFEILSRNYLSYNNLYELDDIIVNELKLSDDVKTNGRLSGLLYLVCYLKSHFKDEEDKLYVSPKNTNTIAFLRFYGWDRLFLDKPVIWSDL